MLSIFKTTVRSIFLTKAFRHHFRIRVRYMNNDAVCDRKSLNPFKKKVFYKNKQENDPKVASQIHIIILGNGAVGQPRCIGLFTEFKGFLFNCGEGVGRLCKEYDVNICFLRDVFITHNNWKNVSGLSDIFLQNDIFGVPKMTFYGPPGVEYFTNVITSHKNNIIMRKKNSFIDDNMQIEHIPIKSSPTFKGQANVSFSYVCKIFQKLGDLNLEKCVELGVPIGPHLLKLKNGEDVTLSSGRTIFAADVLDATCPAMTILIVDCPSEHFLDSFVNEDKFQIYQSPIDNTCEITHVFHFSPDNIITSKKYQAWISKFHQNAHHYILNSSNSSMSSAAIFQTQKLLHLIHPEVYRLLPQEKVEFLPLHDPSKIMYPPPMLQINIRPVHNLNWDNVYKDDSSNELQILTEVPDFNNELNKIKSFIASRKHIKTKMYPEVLFLGTSSATSTVVRNVSAILVNLHSNNSILLDCGEGTLMQMVRYFGKSNISSVLQRISCIFITHKHTDHYLGLFEIIKSRIEAFENSGIPYQPVALILPSEVRNMFYRFFEMYEPLHSKVRVFLSKNLIFENEFHSELSNFIQDIKLLTVPVQHCTNAHGIVLQHGSDWKIVYSGDTVPCQRLIDAGKNCTLLIHEASVEDNLLSEAVLKQHSTPSQVIDVADKMNAQYTIMTHFSKRYLGVPMFKECDHRNVGCAFDFMKLRLHELPLLPLFLPAVKYLFQEEIDTFLQKSASIASFENVFLKTWRAVKSN